MTTANEYLYEINRLNTDVSNFLIKIKSIDKNSMRYAIEKAGIYSKFKKNLEIGQVYILILNFQ